MSLTNPIQSILVSLITDHKVEIDDIPDFYLHSFPYLLGRDNLVLEGFPADLSIKLLDLFVLEQAVYFQTTRKLSLVFFGENSRTISKISSLESLAFTPLIPDSPVVELTVDNLEVLLGATSCRDISNFKDFSVTLVLFLVAEVLSNIIFPPDWQIVVISRDKFEGPCKNMSIDFLKITKSDEGMNIERLQSNLQNSDTKHNSDLTNKPETVKNKNNNEMIEILKSAQMICKNHGYAIDLNDVLLPSLIYTLLGENVIMHTYSEMDFIQVVSILACENELEQISIGNLYICINNSEDRKNLFSFMPSLEFSKCNIIEETNESSCKNFLITLDELYSLKFSKNIHGLLAILSSVPKDLTKALASIPNGFTLLLGTACYSSELLNIMHKSRFVLMSGYPIRPIHCVGYETEKFQLVNLSALPSVELMKPTPLHKSRRKPKQTSTKSKVKSKIEPIPTLPIENTLQLEEHANFLLTSLLQSNYNILINYISSFDPQTYLNHLLSVVDLKRKTLQAIVHGDVSSINVIFEKFCIATKDTSYVAFYFAGGDTSPLKGLLISDKIQILFIPTRELMTALRSFLITIECKVLMCLSIGNTSQSLPLKALSNLHRQTGLKSQIVLVSRNELEIDSNTELVPRPFYLVQESSDLEKERFSVTYCNYSLSF